VLGVWIGWCFFKLWIWIREKIFPDPGSVFLRAHQQSLGRKYIVFVYWLKLDPRCRPRMEKIRSRGKNQQHWLWFTSETNGTYDSPLKPRIYITSESYQFRLEHIAQYSQVPCTVVPGGLIAPQIRAQMRDGGGVVGSQVNQWVQLCTLEPKLTLVI